MATPGELKQISPSTTPSPRGLVWVIARKELLDHLLSLKFHVCLVAMALLLGLSGFVMYRDYQLRMENFAVMRERAKPRPGEAGLMAVVEPRPLSIFAKGLDEVMDRGYTITAYVGIEPHDRQTPAVSLFALFAPPDLLYIVKALLSLIAVLFAYDTVSGEKESGTLKLVLGSAVSRAQLVAAKMLGGLAAVMLPFVALWVGVLAALATRPEISLGGADFSRLGFMLLASLLYVASFFALGVLASALARSSAGSLIVLLFLWATLVFAVPNVGNLIAEQITPLPSAETQELLRMQAFAKDRFLAIQSREGDRVRSSELFNREYDRLVEDYRAKLDGMLGISKAFTRLSPAATLTYIFTDLAGTGLAEQRRVTRALMDYKNRNLPALVRQYEPGSAPPPAFEFQPARLGEILQQGVLTDFMILGFTCAALFVGAVWAFLAVDPR
jgi:ABC-type transport system involved in multi-copper enzyme maturation permease subunit